MKKHWADKPLLRDFFWFLVLPYQLKQWLSEQDPYQLKQWLNEQEDKHG